MIDNLLSFLLWNRHTQRDQSWVAPLLTVEMGTLGVQMKGVLDCSLGSSCRYQRFIYSALAAQYKVFFSPHTFSLYLSLSPINLGRQSCRVAFLFISVSGLIPRIDFCTK
jgi:hypothetical protein